jgi:hypothetical protein
LILQEAVCTTSLEGAVTNITGNATVTVPASEFRSVEVGCLGSVLPGSSSTLDEPIKAALVAAMTKPDVALP